MTIIDHKQERGEDVRKIKDSAHPKKVVVAGPGTGKSFLFQEIIKNKKNEGKKDFVAITFIGKLGDALADDLCGLAETYTMHGFARRFFLKNYKGWNYYPRIHEIIKEDLENEGIASFEIGDENYKKKTLYYKTVGDADVVYYTTKVCEGDNNKIPKHDLVLIDEFQDFNEVEAKFVDLLSLKNEIVIVGDDDQALYGFKGSSPDYIREKYNADNIDFESHTLRFCSRCTEIIIKYFHSIVEKFDLNNPEKNRIQKEYICYAPDKENDSVLNPKIHLIKNCPTGMIAYKVKSELEKIVTDQKIKQVLIIGEGQSCSKILSDIFVQMINYGFRNVDYKNSGAVLDFKQNIIDAYKFIIKDNQSLIGWRILGNPTDDAEKEKHLNNSKTLDAIINGTPSKLKVISDVRLSKLEDTIEGIKVSDKDIRKELLFKEIKSNNVNLRRPLSNLEITICNILNSKGLGADVVFVVGFDQGRLPSKSKASDSEIYQMLVALTRAKKRIYFINTVGKKPSNFIECLDEADIHIEEIKSK